jgi:hypothetical protein
MWTMLLFLSIICQFYKHFNVYNLNIFSIPKRKKNEGLPEIQNTATISCSILPDKKQKSGMFKSSIAISPWSIAADFELQTKS